MPNAPQRSKEKTAGAIEAVPCPWCGHPNDCRELLAQQVLERGCTIDCDRCKKMSVVVAIDTRPRIILKQKH